MTPRLLLAALAAGSLALGACGGDSSVAPDTGAAVASVELTPATTTVSIGRTLTLTATPRSASGAALSGRAITWTATPPNVATVSTTGVVAGVAAGTATITATVEGKSAQRAITVQVAPVASIAIAPGAGTLRLGQTQRLVATTRDDLGTELTGRTIGWESSAPAIAAIDATGLVTAKAPGTVKFTATSESKIATAEFNVEAPVATVTINTALDTLEAWDIVELKATLKDTLGNVLTGRTVRWTSSDPIVAWVDSVTGQLTALDRGTITVTATSEGKTGTAKRVVVIKYRSLSTGSSHACDIASGGIVWCWGLNGAEGRIGNPQLSANTYTAVPMQLNTTVRFQQVSTYGTTSCAVARDGKGYCWGSNAANLLGDGSNVSQRPSPGLVSGSLTFKHISVGSSHACGLTTAGKAYCWGANSDGQLGTGNKTWSSTPTASAGDLTFASISAGTDFTCGVTTAGLGYCWGYSGMGNLADGATPSMGNTSILNPNPIAGRPTFRSISATNQLACGVTTAGVGLCWGRGDQRIGNDVTVPSSMPTAVAGGYSFRSIAAGATSVCGVREDDAVMCWGLNANGQLGQNIANGSAQPVRVTGLLTASDISTANFGGGTGAYACAISVDRLTTRCWGKNDVGQLGSGSTAGPTVVNSTPLVVQGQRPLPTAP